MHSMSRLNTILVDASSVFGSITPC
jgi:hypothetical protein